MIISYHWLENENTHPFVKIEWVLFFIWPILNSIHPRMFVPSLIEIGPVILEKEILKFRQYILLFRSYLPLEKGLALH